MQGEEPPQRHVNQPTPKRKLGVAPGEATVESAAAEMAVPVVAGGASLGLRLRRKETEGAVTLEGRLCSLDVLRPRQG